MNRYGMNMARVRKQNRSSILNYVNDHGPVSRKDIAKATGLTPASVTQITAELLNEQLLQELPQGSAASLADQKTSPVNTEARYDGASTHRAGRKKVLLSIRPESSFVLAIAIETDKTTLALADLMGKPTAIYTIPTESDKETSPENFLAKLTDLAGEILMKHPAVLPVLRGISVSLPGSVDTNTGISTHAPGIWHTEVAVKDILSQRFNETIFASSDLATLPILVENNVNAFASAELLYGIGRSYDNLLVIKWGPGVGSTLVINNEIYRGRHEKAAELGHLIMENDGIFSTDASHGCLEDKISYASLQKIHPFDVKNFGAVYESSSDDTRRDFDDAIRLFARSIVNSILMLAPNRVILYGSLFKSAAIRQKLFTCCQQYLPSLTQDRILYTTLADRENYIGPAAHFMRTQIFS